MTWDGERPAPRRRQESQVGLHVADADARVEGAKNDENEEQVLTDGGQGLSTDDREGAEGDEQGGAPEEHERATGDEQAIRTDLADLERIAAERDDYLDALRRLQADFENYKKRIIKQQTEHLQRAAQDLVEKLLPVLDAVDLARAHGATGEAGAGLEQVGNVLFGALQKEGLERIDPLDKPFDPTEAEAVAHEPGEGGDPRVTEVMRAGYRWKGRVLRPAMVKVCG